MSEADYIDWYEIANAVANGRLSGHLCPKCGGAVSATRGDAGMVRARCGECGEGFEGKLAHGRDDALYAEADRLLRGREAPPVEPDPQRPAPATHADPAPPPDVTRPEPWEWRLDARGDEDGLALWMPVVEAIYNGRRTGLRCPLCSEPLEDILVQPPYIRVRCSVCSEGFEGRLG